MEYGVWIVDCGLCTPRSPTAKINQHPWKKVSQVMDFDGIGRPTVEKCKASMAWLDTQSWIQQKAAGGVWWIWYAWLHALFAVEYWIHQNQAKPGEVFVGSYDWAEGWKRMSRISAHCWLNTYLLSAMPYFGSKFVFSSPRVTPASTLTWIFSSFTFWGGQICNNHSFQFVGNGISGLVFQKFKKS